MSQSNNSQRQEENENEADMSSEDDKIPDRSLNEHTSDYGCKFI